MRPGELCRLQLLHGVRADDGDRQLVIDPPGDVRDIGEFDVVEQLDRPVGVDVVAVDDRLLGRVARDCTRVLERDRAGACRVGARPLDLRLGRAVLAKFGDDLPYPLLGLDALGRLQPG
jgi:hypothetical protein